METMTQLGTAPVGIESQGDALVQNMRERAAAATLALRQKAEKAIGLVEGIWDDLFNGRHTEAEQSLRAVMAKAREDFEAERYTRIPARVYSALQAAESQVYADETTSLVSSIDELRQWPALQGLAKAAEKRLEQSYRHIGGERPRYREAIRLVREGQRIIDRNLEAPAPARSSGSGDPSRAKRDADRRARQLARSVGPKGPSNPSGPQGKGGKKGNGR